MEKIGKAVLTGIRHIKDWKFLGPTIGSHSREAWEALVPLTDNWLIHNEGSAFSSFNPRHMFDIMVNPETGARYAVFIDDILDCYSDVLILELNK